MSTVYLGRDEVLGRPVAVKLLRGGLHGEKGEDTAARFRREGRTAARLSHSNIVPVYDAGETLLVRPENPDEEPSEVSYIVMEYVSGGDLGDLIESGGPLERDRLCGLGAGAADALAHAHGRGIIHRDVKPQNILIDPSGRPKLTDFGIARALEATQATRTGNYLGTALYSSPEQLLGEKVSGKTDVYALGITLYQAATGRPPFQGTMMEVAQEHLNAQPVAPHSRIPGLNRRLSAAIMSCLAKDPGDRPTAEGLSATLTAITGGMKPENLASPVVAPDAPEDESPEPERTDDPAVTSAPAVASAPAAASGASGAGGDSAGRFVSTSSGRQSGGRGGRRNIPALLGLAVVSLVAAIGGIFAFGAMSTNSGSPTADDGGSGGNVRAEIAANERNAADQQEVEVVEPANVEASDSETGAESGAVAAPETSDAAPTEISRSGSEGAVPPGSGASGGDAEAAVAAVRLLYSSAASGDYATSYGLLTENMKQTYAPTQGQWSGQFGTLQSLSFVAEPEVEISGDLATVSGTTRAEHTDRTELNEAVWILILENGQWRLDDQSILNQQLI